MGEWVVGQRRDACDTPLLTNLQLFGDDVVKEGSGKWWSSGGNSLKVPIIEIISLKTDSTPYI